MRMILITGNWKMYKTPQEAEELAKQLKDAVGGAFENGCVAICPVFVALSRVYEVIKGSSIKLGGQDLFWEKEGAFTGEVSGAMLKEAGCSFVIIGHSERRKYFHETNEGVNKKVQAALQCGLTPIVCVGETLKERESGNTLKVVEDHVRGAFQNIKDTDVQKIVIAYEPVWAIGTGVNATPDQAQEVHKYIRGLIAKLYCQELSQNMLILYGGSVKPDNIDSLIVQKDIDGALVGGASLKVESFAEIVNKSLRKNV